MKGRTINELIKSRGLKVSEFIPDVLKMDYRAFLITEKKGSLRVRDAVKIAAALGVSLDELLSDHLEGFNIPVSKPKQEPEETKKALTPMQELEILKEERKKKYSRFLNS